MPQQQPAKEAPAPKPQPPAQVQKTTTEPAKPPTVTAPATPKPASSTLFVSPKVVATPASPFNPNANKAPDLKTGASPSPASSSKVTPTVTPTAKPVLKSDTVIKAKVAPPVLKPKQSDIDARVKATDALISKKDANSQRIAKIKTDRNRLLAGGAGALTVQQQAEYESQLATAEAEKANLQAELEQSKANLQAEQNALRQQPQQQSNPLLNALSFVVVIGGVGAAGLGAWFFYLKKIKPEISDSEE